MERADQDGLAKVNEIIDKLSDTPKNIAQLRRLLLHAYQLGLRTGVFITARRVREWVPLDEMDPKPEHPRQAAENEVHRESIEAKIQRETATA